MRKAIFGMLVIILSLIWLIPFLGGNASAAPITLKVSSWVPPMHVFHRRASSCKAASFQDRKGDF